MTKDEALLVARIMTTAENACPVCAADLLRQFVELKPDTVEVVEQAWVEQFPEEEAGAWRDR